MTGQDWFMFALTFITGVFVGFYVYVTFFKPEYSPDDLATSEANASEFSIIGKEYGGDNDAGYIHPSFRLLADGSYVYVPGGEGKDALEQKEGHVSSGVLRKLRDLASSNELDHFSIPVDKDNCRSYSGGVDHIYRVTVNNEEYVLDTCGTRLDYGDELATELDLIWRELDVPGSTSNVRGNGPYEWLQNFLQDQFVRSENTN